MGNILQKNSVNVLLIEDNENDAYLLKLKLGETAQEKFVIEHAASMEQAMRIYDSAKFDIFLLDMGLPGISGLDALDRILQDTTNTPVVIITGTKDDELANNAIKRGAQDYLIKGEHGTEILQRTIRYAIERKQFESKVIELKYYDRVTGLINTEMFSKSLRDQIQHIMHEEDDLAVLLIGINGMDEINNFLGVEVRDKLLKEIGQRLKKYHDVKNSVARHTRNEFLMLLNGERAAADNFHRTMRHIARIINEPLAVDGNNIQLSCNIGIVSFPTCGRDEKTLIKNADVALLHARESGLNQYQFFASELTEGIAERINISKGLEDALQKNILIPYYQPIIDIKSNRICGVEALLRWPHPEKGFIRPDIFIPVAERSDLIFSVSDYVLQKVCDDYKNWTGVIKQPFSVAVNISAKELHRDDLPDRLRVVLNKNNMSPKHIALEVTETMLMSDPAKTNLLLEKCRKMGCTVSIDDFGTGYSSLSYLSKLPVNTLKIDRSFVNNLLTDGRSRIITTATINLAHNLGMSVVAEGVETSEQLAMLKELGCDKVQGYFFAKPMPADELMNWIRKTKVERLNTSRYGQLDRQTPIII